MPHRRILIAVGAAVLVTAAALVAVTLRDDGREADVATIDLSTTTSTEPVTTTSRPAAPTSSETSTTAAPSTTQGPTTTAPAPPSSAPPTTVVAAASPPPAPPFQSSIETVTREQLGSSWKPDMGCPDPSSLRALNVSHWGYDGTVRQGRIIVAASHAERIVAAFRDLYAARFPIERMVPVDAYGADDQASMRANNTSGFNCRHVADTTTLSQHGKGLAIDVNPLVNPYVKGGTVDPPEGAPYADRSAQHKGMIRAGDAVVQAFARQGWSWGGYWTSGQDYQHFSASGT